MNLPTKSAVCAISLLSLCACGGGSDDPAPTIEREKVTTKLVLGVDLPKSTEYFDNNVDTFSASDRTTYESATTTNICTYERDSQPITLYFRQMAEKRWQVRFTLNDEELTVQQLPDLDCCGKAELEFDDEGNLVKQHPEKLLSTVIPYTLDSGEKLEQVVEFDFYSYPASSKDQIFTIRELKNEGCEQLTLN